MGISHTCKPIDHTCENFVSQLSSPLPAWYSAAQKNTVQLVVMDGKKKGSRTASAALVDDVAAQRPNLDIIMEAIATLTQLPNFFLINVLMHVKRAREVCKAW